MAESAAAPDTRAPEEEPVEIVEFGLWWPAGDPGKLREAADAWDAMASHLDTTTTTLSGAASAVTGANSGTAIDAFATHWNRIGGPQGALPAIAGDCRNMATSLREFADAVDEVREQITQMAIEIAATVAIGVGLAVFTFGTSAGAAAATTSAMVARALTLCTNLGIRAATIISRVAIGAGVGAAEGMAANTIAQLGSNAIFNDNHNPLDGFSMGEVWTSGAFGLAGGGMIGGVQGLRLLRGLDSSKVAFETANNVKSALPKTKEFNLKTVAADGAPTLSGWKQPRPNGFKSATPEDVRAYSETIGHKLEPANARDQVNRSDGWPGKFNASHAEKQQALTSPGKPIGVSKPMCADCKMFFQKNAQHTGRPQIVTDPDMTRVFYPGGRVVEYPL